jgi:hypothetical protein
MLNIKTLAAATVACGLALAVVATESVGSVNRGDRATLSFDRTVTLPGVTLAPGSYVFEIVDNAGYLDVVRVRNSRTHQPEFMGFTNNVPRPDKLKGLSAVTLGEAARSAPAPIKVWFPADGSDGRQFIYQ